MTCSIQIPQADSESFWYKLLAVLVKMTRLERINSEPISLIADINFKIGYALYRSLLFENGSVQENKVRELHVTRNTIMLVCSKWPN